MSRRIKIVPREPHAGQGFASRLVKIAQVISTFACACLMLACAHHRTDPVSGSYTTTAQVIAEPRTVALLGATGMVGGYLLEEALARGHRVRALARTPAKLEQFREQITIVQGDARDPLVVQELLRGSDAVITALGPVKADGDAARFVNTAVTGNVLQAMSDTQSSSYIVVSGAAVLMPTDDRNFLGWWIRTLAQIGLGGALRDKQAEYELLAASSADWVLVRCPLIDAQPFRSAVETSLQTPPAFRVRAGELSRFVLDQLETEEFVRKGPFVGSRAVEE